MSLVAAMMTITISFIILICLLFNNFFYLQTRTRPFTTSMQLNSVGVFVCCKSDYSDDDDDDDDKDDGDGDDDDDG